MKQYVCKMPSGLYYLGDLCYAITDDELWGKMCDEHFTGDFNGKFKTAENLTVWNCSTYCGDGCFEDQDGYFYPVDSGSLGAILIDDNYRDLLRYERVSPLQSLEDDELGRLFYFDKDFEVSYDDGIFYFGNIVINTKE